MSWHNVLPNNTNHNLPDSYEHVTLLFIEIEEFYQIIQLKYMQIFVWKKKVPTNREIKRKELKVSLFTAISHTILIGYSFVVIEWL